MVFKGVWGIATLLASCNVCMFFGLGGLGVEGAPTKPVPEPPGQVLFTAFAEHGRKA